MRIRTCVFLLVAVSVAGTIHGAEGKKPELFLAGSDDKSIRDVLADALPVAAHQLQEYGSDAVLAYTQQTYITRDSSHRVIQTEVWWVKEGQVPDLLSCQRQYPPAWEITEVKAFAIRPGELSVQAALNAPVQRLDPDRIHLRSASDGDRIADLVVSFEPAEPGDILGVSVAATVHYPLSWDTWFLAGDRPVSKAVLRLLCDQGLAYSVFGQGFLKGRLNQEVLFKDRGQIRDLVLRAADIPPLSDEPYSLPYVEQSPCIRVVWRAAQVSWDGKHRLWFRFDNWNQFAAVWAGVERQLLSQTDSAAKLTREMTVGLSAEAAADSLYCFVRDELLTVGLGSFGQVRDEPTVENILRVRAGDNSEKAYLLLAMLRSLDLSAELVWAHDPDDGHFFADYPSGGQLEVPMVLVRFEGRERWYDLSCDTCQPGVIHPLLRGSDAISYLQDADKREETILDELDAKDWRQGKDYFELYLKKVAGENWHTMTKLPGSPGGGAGQYTEMLQWDGTRDGRADFVVSGSAPIGSGRGQTEATEAALMDWFSQRFPTAKPGEVVAEGWTADHIYYASLGFTGSLPEPMGDTWIIPSSALMGETHVGLWTDNRTVPFCISEEWEYRWEASVPLPEGWTEVQTPAACRYGFRCLRYEAEFRVEDNRLILVRRLQEKPIVVDDRESLDLIGQEVKKINTFESSPVVVLHKGGQP